MKSAYMLSYIFHCNILAVTPHLDIEYTNLCDVNVIHRILKLVCAECRDSIYFIGQGHKLPYRLWWSAWYVAIWYVFTSLQRLWFCQDGGKSSSQLMRHVMMTSSNGNIFRIAGPLCGEFTGHRWIPRTKASKAELCVFFDLRLNKRLNKQSLSWWFEMPSRQLWRHCNVLKGVIRFDWIWAFAVGIYIYAQRLLCFSCAVSIIWGNTNVLFTPLVKNLACRFIYHTL